MSARDLNQGTDMTDKTDPHAELMELADDYAKSTHNDGIHGLSGVSLITEGAAGRHAAFARTLTDRLEQAEQEIIALTLSVSNRDARIAEMERSLAFAQDTQEISTNRIKVLEDKIEASGIKVGWLVRWTAADGENPDTSLLAFRQKQFEGDSPKPSGDAYKPGTYGNCFTFRWCAKCDGYYGVYEDHVCPESGPPRTLQEVADRHTPKAPS